MSADAYLATLQGMGLAPRLLTGPDGWSLVLSREGRRVSLHGDADGVVYGTVVGAEGASAWDDDDVSGVAGHCERMRREHGSE